MFAPICRDSWCVVGDELFGVAADFLVGQCRGDGMLLGNGSRGYGWQWSGGALGGDVVT